jgi:nucleoside-diphosphate-sugar epimerase
MTAAITGTSGFVGKNVIDYLNANTIRVSIITRSMLNNIDANELNNANVIIHLAGKAHDTKNIEGAKEYFEINTDLTIKLFDQFLKSNVRDFIYFSSVKAAADTVDGTLTEDVVPNPQTPYGQSKLQAEEYLLAQKLPPNKRLFILRPCMIHGPGNKGNLNLLYEFVQKRMPYPLAAFNNQRSFLSIGNLNVIIGKIISSDNIPGGVYNLADDVSLSTNQVIKIISQISGLKSKLWEISPAVISFLAKIGDKLHLPLNSERLKKLTESYVVSNEKIKKALNITQLPVSSEDGLKFTIKSFISR